MANKKQNRIKRINLISNACLIIAIVMLLSPQIDIVSRITHLVIIAAGAPTVIVLSIINFVMIAKLANRTPVKGALVKTIVGFVVAVLPTLLLAYTLYAMQFL